MRYTIISGVCVALGFGSAPGLAQIAVSSNDTLIATPATNARRESSVGTASSADSDKSFTDFSFGCLCERARLP